MKRKTHHPDAVPGEYFVGRGAAAPYIRRIEHKFEVGVASAAFLRAEIARHLPLFEYHPGFPHTYVTTVYYDTQDRSLFRQAERSYDNNVKIRVKDYSYRDPEGRFLPFPCCFVEIKERTNGTVLKRRVPLWRRDLGRLFAGADVWDSVLELGGGDPSPGLERSYRELRGYLARYRFRASSIISYRRTVYQKSEDEDPRVTFDDSIAVYEAPRRIHRKTGPLDPRNLGRPTRRYDRVILEIKCSSCKYPDWLQATLRHHVSKPLSKFTTSVRSLLECAPPERARSGRAASGSSVEPAPCDSDDASADDEPVEQ